MAVALNEAAIAILLNSPDGPVGIDLRRRAQRVEDRARANASGPIISEQLGELLGALHSGVREDERGLVGFVESDVVHRGWSYPRIVTRKNGKPGGWLSDAVETFNG